MTSSSCHAGDEEVLERIWHRVQQFIEWRNGITLQDAGFNAARASGETKDTPVLD